MKITKENTAELTASLKVEIASEDYQEKVEKQLKDHRKKANMPGFRPGNVPMGMVKKMYGNQIIFDEVNFLAAFSEDISFATQRIFISSPLDKFNYMFNKYII